MNHEKYIRFIGLGIGALVILGMLGFGAWFLLTPSERSGGTVSDLQIRSQQWSGVITIAGDTVFAPWATLTIQPGTRVQFEKNADIPNTDWTKFADAYIKDHNDPTGRVGYGKSHFFLYGKIIATGTSNLPIQFTSAQNVPEYADWEQVIARSGSVFEYIDLAYAHNGLNIDGDNVVVRNSKIHNSLWSCVDVYGTGTLVAENEIFYCWHQAVGVKVPGENRITGNTIHDAQLFVNCEHGANPTIENNTAIMAPINPECPEGSNNTITERPAQTKGGTYAEQLIYPAPEPAPVQ